jgi:hypothetical protein
MFSVILSSCLFWVILAKTWYVLVVILWRHAINFFENRIVRNSYLAIRVVLPVRRSMVHNRPVKRRNGCSNGSSGAVRRWPASIIHQKWCVCFLLHIHPCFMLSCFGELFVVHINCFCVCGKKCCVIGCDACNNNLSALFRRKPMNFNSIDSTTMILNGRKHHLCNHK